MGEHKLATLLDITTWELFFCGAMTLIGKRGASNGSGIEIRPVFQIARAPQPQGMATSCFPVGWFPIEALEMPAGSVSYPISKLGPEERRHLAHAIAAAGEMLQNMRAASSGIAIAREMPPR